MDKDDYQVIVYQILSYLYKCLKKDIEVEEKYLKAQGKLVTDLFALNEDNLWTHSKFGYAVPRRNGKTEVVYMAELWGLFHGLNILHRAHRISTSHSSFEKLKKYLEDMGLIENIMVGLNGLLKMSQI